MSKKYIAIFLLFISNFSVIALPGSPMENWHFTEFTTLNGTEFGTLSEHDDTFGWGKTLADSYREQSGYAVVNGVSVQFWLYDTITYHNGKAKNIYDKYIPYWVEKKGYVIDYDNISVERPYNVPNSVKKLMQQRGCDTAVALFFNEVDIIEFLNSKNIYKITRYPLVRQ